jgi:hypothetical protein
VRELAEHFRLLYKLYVPRQPRVLEAVYCHNLGRVQGDTDLGWAIVQ